ncbi:MAG: tRNA (cytidine(34)-2'-O)-methyltransferase [Sarcina sp.]
MNLNIVLYQPEIPQNTGNIGRTCVLTNSKLHLIKPLGFKIDDKQIKRAGLDYWPHLNLEMHESFEDFMAKYGDQRIFISSTHAEKFHSDAEYQEGDFIMFGKESAGVPKEVHDQLMGIRIPMIDTTDRSLNLSNTVSIVAYEALRQIGFPRMK